MARPFKTGVDYFPLDVNDDDKIELLKAQVGLEGYAILIEIWKRIYKDNGYYINWTDDVVTLFARRNYIGVNEVNSVVNEGLLRSLFDNQMYEKYKILTSNGLQMRYFKICADAKRKKVKVINNYLLVDLDDFKFTVDLMELTPELTLIKSGVNTEQTKVNSGGSTQRRGEESKGKESKEDDNKKAKNVFNFFSKNISLITPFEAEEIEDYLKDGIEEDLLLESLKISIESNAKNWKYAKVILNDCLKKNIKTLEQFKIKELNWENKKSGNRKETKTGLNLLEQEVQSLKESGEYEEFRVKF